MDESYAISQTVSTEASLSDLITTLSSLGCLRAITEGRGIIDLKPDSTVVIHATMSHDAGTMEVSIWVKWKELAPLMFADMLQKSSLTPTITDLVEDILSSRASRNKMAASVPPISPK